MVKIMKAGKYSVVEKKNEFSCSNGKHGPLGSTNGRECLIELSGKTLFRG
jgi:hypothetical protein